MSKPRRKRKTVETPPTEKDGDIAWDATEKPEEKPVEDESQEPTPSLEDQILEIFNKTKGIAITVKYFVDKTGANPTHVGIAWQNLFDQKKVPYPDIPPGY